MAIATNRADPTSQTEPRLTIAARLDWAPRLGTFSIIRDGKLHTRLGGTPEQARIRTRRLSDRAPRHHWTCVDEIGAVLMTSGAEG